MTFRIAVDWDYCFAATGDGHLNPGAKTFLSFAEKNEYSVFILTARDAKGVAQIKRVLDKEDLSRIPVVNVHPDKPNLKLLFDWNVLIDDSPIIYREFKRLEDKRIFILYTQEWNAPIKTLFRADNWFDVIKLLTP